MQRVFRRQKRIGEYKIIISERLVLEKGDAALGLPAECAGGAALRSANLLRTEDRIGGLLMARFDCYRRWIGRIWNGRVGKAVPATLNDFDESGGTTRLRLARA